MKEIVSNLETVRRALQDFLAPELRGIAVWLEAIDKRLETMSGDMTGIRDELRNELHAVEGRMKEAIEQAKRELLLTVRLADAEERIAVLSRKVSEKEQKSPQ